MAGAPSAPAHPPTRTAAIADGADEVLRRTREQLMLGATQIKLMAGGGVTSIYDPIDATQYTVDEIRAAVAAAENWGTYVTVHAYTSRAVQLAIEAGVKAVEHGQLVDEETVKLMVQKGIWWSLQPFLDNELANPQAGANRVKQLMVAAGTDRAYALARKHNVKVAFGTDILFLGDNGELQNARLVSLERWYPPARSCASRPATTAHCSNSPVSAIPTASRWASSPRARSPTCCWSMATRRSICRSSSVPSRASSSS